MGKDPGTISTGDFVSLTALHLGGKPIRTRVAMGAHMPRRQCTRGGWPLTAITCAHSSVNLGRHAIGSMKQAIQDRVGEGHDVALDGRSFLGEPPQVHCEGHVVAEDEIAGLRIGEAHLSQVSSDEGPNIGAGREHRGIRALGWQGHDEHALHCW